SSLPFRFDPFTASAICIALGAGVGAVQGYFVAYYKIPAFIVTLAGMLIFRGFELEVLGGASVGPFSPTFQALSNGYVADPFAYQAFGAPFNLLAVIIGVIVTGAIIYYNIKERRAQLAHDLAEEPSQIFIARNLLLAVAFIGFSALMAQYKGLP